MEVVEKRSRPHNAFETNLKAEVLKIITKFDKKDQFILYFYYFMWSKPAQWRL